MSYALVTPDAFIRQARKFFQKHPDLKPKFKQVLNKLQDDPFAPALRLHALSGQFAGLHAVSLTFSYRLTLSLQITGQEIILLDIGSHDEVYR
ncbi:MAG: plasmid stabilization protein [Hydrogenophilales bacterium]|nr:plasmid stabilization protein [Hydrogenophilales bacterium]